MVDYTDVLRTGIFGHTGNPTSGVTNGRSLVSVLPTGKNGSIDTLTPLEEYIPDSSGQFSRATNRFDDPTYYTA